MSSGADVSSTVTVSTMLSGTILAGYKTEGVTVMYREGVSVEIAITLLARYSFCVCVFARYYPFGVSSPVRSLSPLS